MWCAQGGDQELLAAVAEVDGLQGGEHAWTIEFELQRDRVGDAEPHRRRFAGPKQIGARAAREGRLLGEPDLGGLVVLCFGLIARVHLTPQ